MTDAGGTDPGLESYVPPAPDSPSAQRPRWRKAGIAISVVIALVAGLFGLAALTSDGGEDTPEAAVQKLVDALVNEDVLGAFESIVPAERTLLRGRIVELSDQLRRLGIADDRLDLGRIPGADLIVDGLELESEQLAEDLAAVRAKAGTARLVIKGDELPIGPLLKNVAKEAGTIPSPPPADLSNDDVMLVAVRRDGNWFVSLGYTAAELARRDADAPMPKFGRGVAPKGSSSPEAAVRELAAAAAALDVRRVIELAPPGEADALHDYAPLFLPAAEAAVAEMRKEGVRAEVPTLELGVASTGDGEARVTIERLAFNVTTGQGRYGFDYDGRCVTVAGPEGDASPPLCRDDKNEDLPFGGAAFSYFQLTVVEHNGDWFVSPTGSVLDAMLGSLRALEREELAKVVDDMPYALFLLLYPSPILLGAGAFEGIDSQERADFESGSDCVRAETEGTSENESVAVPCTRPVPSPARAVPPAATPVSPPDRPRTTSLSPQRAAVTTTSAPP